MSRTRCRVVAPTRADQRRHCQTALRCVSDKVLPSGSRNHATAAPLGETQIPRSSWPMPAYRLKLEAAGGQCVYGDPNICHREAEHGIGHGVVPVDPRDADFRRTCGSHEGKRPLITQRELERRSVELLRTVEVGYGQECDGCLSALNSGSVSDCPARTPVHIGYHWAVRGAQRCAAS